MQLPIFKEQANPTAANMARQRLQGLVLLARPKHWIKNGLVAAALLFSGNLLKPGPFWLTVLAFAGLSLASSAVYSLNDALDAQRDRLHPKKRLRPVASGMISPATAVAFAVLLAAAAAGIGFTVNATLGLITVLYLAINVAYCFWLKHIVILDIMSIAAGFVLRALAGAAAISVSASIWFLVCVSLLSLFLAAAKRRHEVLTVSQARDHRKVLEQYPVELLNQMLSILSSASIVAYLLYVTESNRPGQFILASPMVLYGIFRYLYLVHHRSEGGAPEDSLLSDIPLLLSVAAWGLTNAVIIYLL